MQFYGGTTGNSTNIKVKNNHIQGSAQVVSDEVILDSEFVNNTFIDASYFTSGGINSLIANNTFLNQSYLVINGNHSEISGNNFSMYTLTEALYIGGDGGVNNTISNNNINDGYIVLTNSAVNNTLFNNTVNTSVPGNYKLSATLLSSGNEVTYLNDQGIINWTLNPSSTLREYGELGIGTNPIIQNNLIGFVPGTGASSGLLNSTATLTFYNVAGITIPTPYRNGAPCGGSICTAVTSLGGNNYTFNVTQFSNYSVGDQSNNAPTASNVILNSTYGTNLTTENLTLYWDVTDLDGDNVKNITNWYVNGTSIIITHLPFEGISLSASGAEVYNVTKDYSGMNIIINGTNITWNSTGGFDGFGAYECDGVKDGGSKLEIPEVLASPPNNFTISMWFKPALELNSSMPNEMGIFSKINSNLTNNFLICYFMNGSGNIECRVNGEVGTEHHIASTSQNVWDEGQWYHFAFTWDQTTGLKMYVNGTLDGSNSSATDVMLGGQFSNFIPLYLGKATFSDALYSFNGTIDDFIVFNRSLSPEQIEVLADGRNDLIVSQETNPGDMWNATITPNDRIEDGMTVWSNPLTILDVCHDDDGDGFNRSQVDCGVPDCNDNNASVFPPHLGLQVIDDTLLCNGTYYLNTSTQVINISSNNLTLECNQTVIVGNISGKGLFVQDQNNLTIKGCTFISYNQGMSLSNVSDSNVTNNSIYNTTSDAIYVINSVSDLQIYDNTINTTSSRGISIWDSNNSIVKNNLLIDGGIYLRTSDYNLIQDNNILDGYIQLEDPGAGATPDENILLNNSINSSTPSFNKLIITARGTGYRNYVIYQNIAGVVNWTINNILTLTENATLGLGVGPIIQNNFVSFTPGRSDSLLNQSATITLYDVTGIDIPPIAYRNGQPCDPSICSDVVALGGDDYTFNVTQFSNYSLGNQTGYNITVWIDGVLSDTFADSGIPYNLTIQINDSDGNPVEGAEVRIKECNGINHLLLLQFAENEVNNCVYGTINTSADGTETLTVIPTGGDVGLDPYTLEVEVYDSGSKQANKSLYVTDRSPGPSVSKSIKNYINVNDFNLEIADLYLAVKSHIDGATVYGEQLDIIMDDSNSFSGLPASINPGRPYAFNLTFRNATDLSPLIGYKINVVENNSIFSFALPQFSESVVKRSSTTFDLTTDSKGNVFFTVVPTSSVSANGQPLMGGYSLGIYGYDLDNTTILANNTITVNDVALQFYDGTATDEMPNAVNINDFNAVTADIFLITRDSIN